MSVAEIEAQLVSGPYGDSSSVRANSDTLYAGTTELFRDVFPGCGLRWPWPDSVQERVLIRGAVSTALEHLAADPDAARSSLDDAVNLIGSASDVSQDPLPANGHPAALRRWEANPLGDALLTRFHSTMRTDGHSYTIKPVMPDGRESAAINLLAKLLPTAAPSVVSLVDGLCIFTGQALTSAYAAGTPGLIYVSRALLDDPLETADAIFHECLHQKLAEVELTRRVLRPGYSDDTGPRIVVPWGGDGRQFSVDRSLGAFHVYVHCALLHLAALMSGDYGFTPPDIQYRLEIRWSRASFFASELHTPQAQAELGPDGRRLVRWLAGIVRRLGDCPNGGGHLLSSVHRLE